MPGLRECFRALVTGCAPWPLFLYGPPGTGKTCAGLTFCDFTMGRLVRESDLCEAVMTIGDRSVYREMSEPRLLVIDEIGLRPNSGPGTLPYSALLAAVDARWDECSSVFVAISNVHHDAIASIYDDRLADRLTSGTLFDTAQDVAFVGKPRNTMSRRFTER